MALNKSLDLAPAAAWFKSSYSGNGNNCVEVADLTATPHRAVGLRDSNDPNGPALLLPPATFAHFISDVRDGKFDL
ncbi:DUF397 domain-containing protein [Streptomyces noursei]|uniref:Toxin n=1 Tax=Streptomyces noursei TaxID=1971 RepID=A0A2N8PR76_STRNR|nr:DUF397 domain-containing protein [Streptomyces noursei]PNE43497.1 toxin [Streptomyces noursei]